jgi:hypothetical protein
MALIAVDHGSFQTYLPYAVGCGVVAAILVALAARRRTPPAPLDEPPEVPSSNSPPNWEAHDTSFADRRGSVRREGAPVRVVLSSPIFVERYEYGWVLNRSKGGLRLALATAVAPGTGVQIRAENAPDTIPWVTIVIRSCRDNGDYFELGCEFEKNLPWNVLLLFG